MRRSNRLMVAILAALALTATACNRGDQSNRFSVVSDATTPDAANPAVGNQDNRDPVFETVTSWRDLVDTVKKQNAAWYKQCLVDRVGVTWEQAEKYAQLNDQGHDLRFILVSNSSVSDKRARELLKEDGFKGVDKLEVVRLNGFENTRGLKNDRCQPFGDARSQVRVSLAIPKDVNDLKKGFHRNKGVLAMCSNPWRIPSKGKSAPPPTTHRPHPSFTPKPTPTPTPTCRSGKCKPPRTVPPPQVTVPPGGGSTSSQPNNGGQGDSGDGATNTTSPPRTESSAPAPDNTSPPATNPPPPPP